MTLLEALTTLPAGSLISTTKDFRKATSHNLTRVTVSEAVAVVESSGYADKPAERNGNFIEVYSGGMWFPWKAFRVE